MLGYIVIGYLIYRLVKAYRRSNKGMTKARADQNVRDLAATRKSVARGLAQSEAGEVVDLGDFSQYL